MRILVLGADGYLGWPTAMNLSASGHEVMAVDNYLRRNIAREENVEPLYRVPNLIERCRLWKEQTGHEIKVEIANLAEWGVMEEIFSGFCPDTIVHYAEQPSAPYSMLSRRSADLTLHNNLGTTFNVIYAMQKFTPSAHLVKLGTMGEYGTPDIDIEEGWLDITHNGRSDKFLFPRQAGSLYHTTKIMDTDMLWYYVRMWGLRVTDLMQGPVYGIFTNESRLNDELLPFFSYDELFGTVVNRFVVQAVTGYPLTVYGKGGQTRGYLNIQDTLNCVRISLENPPEPGLRIFNQLTETFTVNEIADRVQRVGKDLGLDVTINQMENPRKEAEEHYYNPKCTGLLDLGLEPNYLTDEVMTELIQTVIRFRSGIHEHKIFRGVRWS